MSAQQNFLCPDGKYQRAIHLERFNRGASCSRDAYEMNLINPVKMLGPHILPGIV